MPPTTRTTTTPRRPTRDRAPGPQSDVAAQLNDTPTKSSALARIEQLPADALAEYRAAGYDQTRLAMIWQQCARDLNLGELVYFMERCIRTGLDPLRKQIYAIKRRDQNSPTGYTVAHQTGIDGFRAIANSSGVYAGSDPPEFLEPIRWKGKDAHEICRVTVYKIVQGVRVPFVGEARLSEFYPGDKNGAMWQQYPHNQLAKSTEAQALRKGFPVELGEFEIAGEMGGARDGEAQFTDQLADRATPIAENVRALDSGDRDANAAEYVRLYGDGSTYPVEVAKPAPTPSAVEDPDLRAAEDIADVPPWLEAEAGELASEETERPAAAPVNPKIAARLEAGLCTHPECVEHDMANKAAADTDPPRCLNHIEGA